MLQTRPSSITVFSLGLVYLFIHSVTRHFGHVNYRLKFTTQLTIYNVSFVSTDQPLYFSSNVVG